MQCRHVNTLKMTSVSQVYCVNEKIKHCLKRFPDFPELLSRNFLMYTRRKPSGQTEESLTIGELKTHTTGRNLEDNFEEILKTNRKGRKFSSLHRLRRRMGRAGTVDWLSVKICNLGMWGTCQASDLCLSTLCPHWPPHTHSLSPVNSSSCIFILLLRSTN